MLVLICNGTIVYVYLRVSFLNFEIFAVYLFLRFPSAQFLGLGQMVSAVLMLLIAKNLGYVSFPSFDYQIPQKAGTY